MNTTPLEYYREQCNQGLIVEDPAQLAAMQHLQRVYQDLLTEEKNRNSLLAMFRKPQLVQGVYLWGGVGIGKTLLMDCLYHSLPTHKKMRMHFYQFMQLVHRQLTEHQGEKDPLQKIAKELANKTIVICFDELFVSDITDAMLLGRLFSALLNHGVCLIATSNAMPDDLYKNGLQRINFLPAIALLKKNMEVIHIPTSIDYRLRHLQEAGVFYTPLDEAAANNMEKSFFALIQDQSIQTTPITLHGRRIRVRKRTDKVIWFDFYDICTVPRSQQDYLAITEQYHTVLISDIPAISVSEKDTICLFISLIDVLYDARVRLVISSAEPVEKIYERGYMISEYTRTHSRLLEMQSLDYFSGEETVG